MVACPQCRFRFVRPEDCTGGNPDPKVSPPGSAHGNANSCTWNRLSDSLIRCPRLWMRLFLGLILSLGIVAAEQPKMFPPGSLGHDDDWDRFRSDQLSGCLRSFK